MRMRLRSVLSTSTIVLFEAESVVIGGTPIKMIALLQNEPVDVGTDDNNVYERVIELDLYYEREATNGSQENWGIPHMKTSSK